MNPSKQRLPFDFAPPAIPRSVYIHIPFCRHRCGYCNFSLVAGRDYLVDRFLNALESEIDQLDRSYEIDTLYFGGGTPSHLSPVHLDRLNQIVRSRFSLSSDCEVTAECNPSDLNSACAQALAMCGVNRISLGVQSLNARKLKTLERDHNLEVVQAAVDTARNIASSISIDLIFATPGETFDDWKNDLSQAIRLQPDHFSTYELTYEKGTSFWSRRARKELCTAEEETRCQMYEYAIDELAVHGFDQYEISSFSKLKHQSRHNSVYWSGNPYFAFGPSASSFVAGVRETNHQSTTQYLKLVESGKSPVAQRESLSARESALEQLAIGLRRNNGIERDEFFRRTGFDALELIGEPVFCNLRELELIQISDENMRLTRRGLLVCDWIAGEILAR